MSGAAIAILIGAVVPTAFISGIFGMAGGILLMGVFVWLLPVAQAMVLHGVTQTVSNGSRAIMLWPHIQWGVVGQHLIGATACVALLAQIAFIPDLGLVLVILGLIPFAHRFVRRLFTIHIKQPGVALLGGVITMGFQLMSGVAGPILDTLYVNSPLDKLQVVATKAATQALSHIFKTVYFTLLVVAPLTTAIADNGSLPVWLFAATAALAVVGTVLGNGVLRRMGEAQFRVWTQYVVLAIGVVFLTRAAIVTFTA